MTLSAHRPRAVPGRRQGLAVLAALAATLAWPAAGQAADAAAGAYPSRAVRFIVPVSAGGSTDKIARVLAEKLAQRWGQPVIVENVTGAGGTIGATRVARAKPDGYTLLFHSDAIVLNQALYAKPPYRLDDLAGVSRAIVNPQVLVVRPSLGVTTFQQYLALARSKPGQVSVGLPTSGGIAHIAHEMFRQKLGFEVNYIPYSGGAPAALDVMGGHTDATIITAAAVTEYIKQGKLVPLAVTTPYRSPALPQVPTIAELGVPGFDVESWQGILAPAGTPRAVIGAIHAAVDALLKDPAVRSQAEGMGYGVAGSTPEAFDRMLREDLKRYGEVIRAAGITLQ